MGSVLLVYTVSFTCVYSVDICSQMDTFSVGLMCHIYLPLAHVILRHKNNFRTIIFTFSPRQALPIATLDLSRLGYSLKFTLFIAQRCYYNQSLLILFHLDNYFKVPKWRGNNFGTHELINMVMSLWAILWLFERWSYIPYVSVGLTQTGPGMAGEIVREVTLWQTWYMICPVPDTKIE